MSSDDQNVPYDAAIGDSGGKSDSSTKSGDSKQKGAKDGKAPKLKKQKVEKRAQNPRGIRITPEKRVKDHPGDFFVKGQEMWCLVCQVPVCHRQTVTISRHLNSAKHSERKRKFSATVFTPGPAAAVVNPPAASSQPAVTGV